MGAGEWREIFDGRDVSDWQGLEDRPHEWQAAGAVSLHPGDSARFDIQAGEGVLVNGAGGRTANLLSGALHGDCELHIEFVVPEGSNSGVYMMGRYEIQVLDSWGATELKYNACGGIYCRWIDEQPVGGAAPRVNASRPPGEWQAFDVVFRAPRFGASGRKAANAIFERVVWNGEMVHENVALGGPTRAGLPGPEVSRGPLMLQGDHGPVAYRNIRIREIG